jgi:hypothetical protein
MVIEYLAVWEKSQTALAVARHGVDAGFDSLFAQEYAVALVKYPELLWQAYERWEMLQKLKREVRELELALWVNDIHGEHGILREATHVQVVAQRIIDEMTRRSSGAAVLERSKELTIVALGAEISYHAARSDIEYWCAPLRVDGAVWYDSLSGDSDEEAQYICAGVMYLELRDLLARHPEMPNLVRPLDLK